MDVVEGSSYDVFVRARDLVHLGWRFLAHPLYGNFHPAVQPYRTLILQEPEGEGFIVDMESFSMLETALASYRTDKKSDFPDAAKADFATLDMALTRETITMYLEGGLQ